MTDKIILSGLIHDSITDGPGLRLAVFTQGCPHKCKGCHNEQTWQFDAGTPWTAQQLINEVKKNPLLDGVTLTGGEPMAQAVALLPFAEFLKEAKIELAVYSGYTFEEIMQNSSMLKLLNLAHVLIDGRFEIEKRSLNLPYKGSSNQRTINVQQSLANKKVVLMQNSKWN